MKPLYHDLDSASDDVDTLGHTPTSLKSASAYSRTSSDLRRSSLTVPLQCVLGRPGSLINPGTSRYKAGDPSTPHDETGALLFLQVCSPSLVVHAEPSTTSSPVTTRGVNTEYDQLTRFVVI